METRTFTVVTSISMLLALTVAVFSIIGIAITGLYPGILVFLLVALIPIASKFYAKKFISKSNDFQRNYYTTLTIINLLSIVVVLWMTFVILHDAFFMTVVDFYQANQLPYNILLQCRIKNKSAREIYNHGRVCA